MFVTRSRYDRVASECEGLMNELTFMRSKYKDELKLREELEKRIEQLYDEARMSADAKSRLAERVRVLEKQVDLYREIEKKVHTPVGVDVFDYLPPEPDDAEERKYYVSRMSGYFTGGLNAQLKYMIGSFKNQLALFPLTERETDFYRSCVNVCQLLIEYGERLFNEHVANAQEEKGTVDTFDTSDGADEAVEKIKEAVNR